MLGSLLSDLGYFLFLFPEATFDHSLLGVFILDLPAGLVLWGVSYGLLKRRQFWKGRNRGRLLLESLMALILAGFLTRYMHTVKPKSFYMTLYFTDALAVQWIVGAVWKNVRKSRRAPAPLRSS